MFLPLHVDPGGRRAWSCLQCNLAGSGHPPKFKRVLVVTDAINYICFVKRMRSSIPSTDCSGGEVRQHNTEGACNTLSK